MNKLLFVWHVLLRFCVVRAIQPRCFDLLDMMFETTSQTECAWIFQTAASQRKVSERESQRGSTEINFIAVE